eukprot:TRINITY_DN10498_c0_g1_i1.p1 TRINITY_DN10498_c0_g1~~TRINITY_DN10498_c0_g1_i1.p1  ORF type:complete len:142 (+),score=44.63 TRINITY_DN10498_c0_g1_i1:66-428(+)
MNFSLDLSAKPEVDEDALKSPVGKLELAGSAKSYDEESDIHEDITIIVKLDGDRTEKIDCKTGETIMNIKKKIHDDHGVPFSCVVSFQGKPMLDPLSLNDFPHLIAAHKEGKAIEFTVAH